jgi:acyl-[acyl-carrier-protein] desaturase
MSIYMGELYHADKEPLSIPDRELLLPSRVFAFGREAVKATGRLAFPGEPDQLSVLYDLEQVVESELNRHNGTRKPWVPHDFLPLDAEGRIIGHPSRLAPEEQPLLSEVAQAAMIVNLLTEDNLPSYHRVIANNFGLDGPWGTWVGQWTAEEDNHAYVMRSFLDLTQAIDPAQNEKERYAQMLKGYNVEKDPLHTLAYVTFQELATRVSHRQTGVATKNNIAEEMLKRIAMDENLHMIFYRNLAAAAFDLAPNQMMRAIADEVIDFEMPGSNIAGFQSRSLQIAGAGIYDLRRHKDEVVLPVLKKWKVFERTDLGPTGEAAREELEQFLVKLGQQASQFEEKRDSGVLERTIAAQKRRELNNLG